MIPFYELLHLPGRHSPEKYTVSLHIAYNGVYIFLRKNTREIVAGIQGVKYNTIPFTPKNRFDISRKYTTKGSKPFTANYVLIRGTTRGWWFYFFFFFYFNEETDEKRQKKKLRDDIYILMGIQPKTPVDITSHSLAYIILSRRI